jgi:hypothetical protein
MALHPAIRSMLGRYPCETKQDYKNALKEIVQEVALLGLSRHGFFDKAAFYGGTALRIAHKLDRFSEDLDFELLKEAKSFQLERYLSGITDELQTYGLKMTASFKKKNQDDSKVESAFIKGNTLEHLLLIEGLEDPSAGINKNDRIKIKLEVDTDPPRVSPQIEVRYHQNPIPFSYRILDLPSLFSGKLHAIICRNWGHTRVKGRDFFDFIWFRNQKIEPNYEYLKSKLSQSGHWNENHLFGPTELKELLKSRFESINWDQAKNDIEPFIKDPFALEVWSTDFFLSLL